MIGLFGSADVVGGLAGAGVVAGGAVAGGVARDGGGGNETAAETVEVVVVDVPVDRDALPPRSHLRAVDHG